MTRPGQADREYLGVEAQNPPNVFTGSAAPSSSFSGDNQLARVGDVFIDESAPTAYMLTKVTGGSRTWALIGPGASDVDTLTADSGGALSPSGGNITLAGGTNITSVGSGSTITHNLDDAISLATSVTSPLYTASAADVDITAPSGQDIVMKVGDAAGANKLSLVDSAGSEVFSVDSNGGQTYTTITATGLITGQASATINTAGTALTLAADNSADAVILGGGTSARAITIGQDAAAHTVAIGQAAAGAITLDSAAEISLDAAAASNFSVSGAGVDLTLASAGGRVVVNGEEAAADAVRLLSAAGGLDADVALQMNLTSSQAASDAVRIDASDASGGVDIDDGGGGTTLDSLGAISIDAAAASNFSVSGAGVDLTLASSAGRVVVNGEEAAANAVTLLSAAGGIDADCALQMNLASSQAASDAVRIDASDASGGVDIDDGGGGTTLDSLGAISIDAAAASNFSVSGAGIDLTLASSAGRVVVNGEEAAANAVTLLSAAGGIDADCALQMNLASSQAASDAIRIVASNASGGIDIDDGGGGITIDAAGALSLDSTSASNLTVTGASADLTLSSSGGSVNITATEAAADAIVVSASDASGGITLDAGSGGVNLTGADLDVQGGNVQITGAAQQLQVEGGAATDFIGQATLTNGQVTVNNTNIAANDRIILTRSAVNASTALGHLLTTINAATSFTIEAKQSGSPGTDETGDQSTIDYLIVRNL